jgi:hypothetical protein
VRIHTGELQQVWTADYLMGPSHTFPHNKKITLEILLVNATFCFLFLLYSLFFSIARKRGEDSPVKFLVCAFVHVESKWLKAWTDHEQEEMIRFTHKPNLISNLEFFSLQIDSQVYTITIGDSQASGGMFDVAKLSWKTTVGDHCIDMPHCVPSRRWLQCSGTCSLKTKISVS